MASGWASKSPVSKDPSKGGQGGCLSQPTDGSCSSLSIRDSDSPFPLGLKSWCEMPEEAHGLRLGFEKPRLQRPALPHTSGTRHSRYGTKGGTKYCKECELSTNIQPASKPR